MYKPANMSLWQGRIDNENPSQSLRWHQRVSAWRPDQNHTPTSAILGFACDEGVRRNQGRTGAKFGPVAIRQALSNMAYQQTLDSIDAGDIICEGQALEAAQVELAQQVSALLVSGHFPIVLGGGHEMAWGSFQGAAGYLEKSTDHKIDNHKVGIINFDAHFDLRDSVASSQTANSGTPFRQIAQWCETKQCDFRYCVLGINPSANTDTLFDYARKKEVFWREDLQCTQRYLQEMTEDLAKFIAPLDYLYLTICLDAFSAASAPGVSAPSVLGIEPAVGVELIRVIKYLCTQYNTRWLLADIAELNPELDIDSITAKLGARLVYEICR